MYKKKYYLYQESAFRYNVVKEIYILWISWSYEYVNDTLLTKPNALKLLKKCQK